MPKLVMGVTLIMGVTILLVLALVLVLLAELYCSLLSKRRRPRISSTAAAQQGREEGPPIAVPLPLMSLCPGSSAYDQGVLRAPPGSLLRPIVKEQQQQQQSHHASGTSLHFMGLISTTSSPTPPLGLSRCPPAPPRLPSIVTTFEENNSTIEEDGCGNGYSAAGGKDFIYISNPIYDYGEEAHIAETPFETPDTSPSRLLSGSPSPPNYTPPLTPMKKLPLSASSVALMDGSALIASVSGTDSNAGSSSSSGSPCTSPSW